MAKHLQQQLGKSELVIITERVDDVALWLAQMMKMGLPEILDQHLPKLPKRWQQEGLSWGWTAVIWLSYILSEVDRFGRTRRCACWCSPAPIRRFAPAPTCGGSTERYNSGA